MQKHPIYRSDVYIPAEKTLDPPRLFANIIIEYQDEELKVTIKSGNKPAVTVLRALNLKGLYQVVIYRPGQWIEILQEKEKRFFAPIDDSDYFPSKKQC